MLLATSALVGAQTGTATAVKTGYAPVNGISLYYEIHGGGEPLILLHGGRTTDIDRALSFEAMADDMAALMKHLGIEKADVWITRLAAARPCARPSSIPVWSES